jgi:prophage regulatory protein
MNSSNTHQAPVGIEEFLRLPQVLKVRGLKQSAHYQNVVDGLYTKPVKISSRAAGWPLSEVRALNSARIAGKSNDEIRTLVKMLTAARAVMA